MGHLILYILIAIAAVILLLWAGLKITGSILGILFWLVVKLPISIVLFVVGALMCCTIIFIPVGRTFIRGAGAVLA